MIFDPVADENKLLAGRTTSTLDTVLSHCVCRTDLL